MHGDHVWGLPSVTVSTLLDQGEKRSLHIYGPVGLHGLLVTSLGYAHCKLGPLADIVVHELISKEDETESVLFDAKVAARLNVRHEPLVAETTEEGGRVWRVFEDDHFTVTAASVRHTAQCFGYVVDEKTRKRRVDAKRAAKAGLPPGRIYRELQEGRDVQLPDGKVVRASDVTSPPSPSRRIVLLGDTSYPSKDLRAIARGADVVVHEATMSDTERAKAIGRGHSTPSMAGAFARDINAALLVLTHFSGRFMNVSFQKDRLNKSAAEIESIDTLVAQAKRAFCSANVLAAKDFLCLSVPRGGFEGTRKHSPTRSTTKAGHNVVLNQFRERPTAKRRRRHLPNLSSTITHDDLANPVEAVLSSPQRG